MRRALKISAWGLGSALLLFLVLVAAVWMAGNTESGRGLIERLTDRLTAGYVKLSGLGGSFPVHLTLAHLQLIDHEGVWLTADDIDLTWSPLRLLERRIQVDTLHVARLDMERAPVGNGKGGGASVPHIEVGQFTADRVELGAPLTGTAVALSAYGSVRLRSLDDAATDLVVRRLGGDGDYSLHLKFDPRRLDASLAVHEPAGGPLEHILSLPGLGALSAAVTLAGPHDAAHLNLSLAAGDLRAGVQGNVDLAHATADLDYSLTAPALSPRPDVAWSGVTLQGDWHGGLTAPSAAGRLDVDGLRIAGGELKRLHADLTGSAGKLAVAAVIDGLRIPGPAPGFLAADPLKIEASLQLDDAARPLQLSATHPLFTLREQGATVPGKEGLRAEVQLRVPEMASLSVFTGEDVRGTAVVDARLVHRTSEDALALVADLGLAGGTAPWLRFAGPRVAAKLSGALSESQLKIDSLTIAAGAASFAASGSAMRAMPAAGGKPDARNAPARLIKDLQANWQLKVADLAAFADGIGGDLEMSGQLSGTPASLRAEAELTSQLSVHGSAPGTIQATVQVRGLPSAPSGALQAHGMVDGAPLRVDAAVERRADNALRLWVRQAEWKSAHADGDMTADASFNASHGQLHLRVGQLGDLNRILGLELSGSLTGEAGFVPAGGGRTQAELALDSDNLAVGPVAGALHLKARGAADALGLELRADLPHLQGAPASVASTALLDLDKKELRITGASLGYRGETVRLLRPASLSFANGFSFDEVKLGAREAVLDVEGRLTPSLDLRASMKQVTPALVNVFAPGLLAAGSLDARAVLQGSWSDPTGSARVDAAGARFADDAATGLPALNLHARAQFADHAATLNATLAAGANTLTASGTVPLDVNAPVDLKVAGTLDMGLANPLLEARGMRAAGALSVNATVTGAAAAPQVGGGITLAHGSIRDYARGVNLTDISAEIVGSEGTLQIKTFSAKAASGSVAMTGSFGILQKGLPLDLKITAKDAQPIASNLITANLDADIGVHGTLRERLDVTGSIDVQRATINIPNSLPPDVAVLDVRRRGQAAAPDEGKQLIVGLDVTVHAPRQILVEGRGLDAEFGGDIHLGGTTDAPLASGGLDLIRGSFTLAGNKLSFDPSSKISFDGAGLRKKIDPTLDFKATTTLPNGNTATLLITGVADAPRFEFSSSGGLPPDEILAQLLFGESASSLTALQVAQIGAALATLSGAGGSGSFNPLVKLQKSLGLDRLSVGSNTTTTATGATENSGAAIEAGRYVSKRVYVEAKQTTVGTSQVQVQVDLTKHLKLQTRLGNGTAAVQGTTPENDPGSSVGLSYQFEY